MSTLINLRKTVVIQNMNENKYQKVRENKSYLNNLTYQTFMQFKLYKFPNVN